MFSASLFQNSVVDVFFKKGEKNTNFTSFELQQNASAWFCWIKLGSQVSTLERRAGNLEYETIWDSKLPGKIMMGQALERYLVVGHQDNRSKKCIGVFLEVFMAILNKYCPEVHGFCFLRTLCGFQKSALMNYVALRPQLEKHKQPVKHISTPMASFVAARVRYEWKVHSLPSIYRPSS